jgi:hypothetical protein
VIHHQGQGGTAPASLCPSKWRISPILYFFTNISLKSIAFFRKKYIIIVVLFLELKNQSFFTDYMERKKKLC